jgi:hypothetical protein
MIIGISGLCLDTNAQRRTAGAGKGEVANRLLRQHSFVELSWADPMKRFCQDVYQFSDEQLWGGSELRVAPDIRYPLPHEEKGTPVRYLTPRLALQRLGDEWGRSCYAETWVDYGIRTIQRLQAGGYTYSPQQGLRPCCYIDTDAVRPKTRVVVSDLRYFNELSALRVAGGKIIRVRRQLTSRFDSDGMQSKHASETELPSLEDAAFDYIIDNTGISLQRLHELVDHAVAVLSGRVLAYNEKLKDVPPGLR